MTCACPHDVVAARRLKLTRGPDDKAITFLGIETSCDDTAAAIVRLDSDGGCTILANTVWSQHADHAAYGGVVPEIAARSHVERVDVTVERTFKEAGLAPSDLDGVAATAGPGLVGGVMVGLTTAKAIAMRHDLPLIPINHLEGHALSVRLTEKAPFPYLLLLVSGGHTQLVQVHGLGNYERLGVTIDDAAGEAFDKSAKLLGLGQPGGPRIEKAAKTGDASRFRFPLPLAKHDGCNFSFSGLKTAVRDAAATIEKPTEQDAADLAASFQKAAARHLAVQTQKAMRVASPPEGERRLVVAGGVAANLTIRAALDAICKEDGWSLIAPPLALCTDNGAMIAIAGAERARADMTPSIEEALSFAPRPRWPLAAPIEGAEIGGGKKGPKA